MTEWKELGTNYAGSSRLCGEEFMYGITRLTCNLLKGHDCLHTDSHDFSSIKADAPGMAAQDRRSPRWSERLWDAEKSLAALDQRLAEVEEYRCRKCGCQIGYCPVCFDKRQDEKSWERRIVAVEEIVRRCESHFNYVADLQWKTETNQRLDAIERPAPPDPPANAPQAAGEERCAWFFDDGDQCFGVRTDPRHVTVRGGHPFTPAAGTKE